MNLRKTLIAANWKSNGTLQFVNSFFSDVLQNLKYDPQNADVLVAPMSIHLELAKKLAEKNRIIISSQNVSATKPGAFTGEIPAESIKDLGIEWTIIGHSERRSFYGDNNQVVVKKLERARDIGLTSILCVGETKEEREKGQTLNVIFDQFKEVESAQIPWKNIVIAYEPVWAIGTGLTATPDQAQEVHKEIRAWLKANVKNEKSVDSTTRILYGGSVNAKNADELIKQKDIDGFLVGGASLKPEFADIVRIASSAKKI